MATSPRSPGAALDGFDSSKPFRGVVVCCTSIPPDLRTDISNKTAELGGVHKYDLTPDCTHLIVGEYDTPKYRHVAKERPDVKPMDAAWIEAVRDLWMQDADIDFDALEAQWQLKTFERSGSEPTPDGGEPQRRRLICCMTGFEDPDVRQEIIERVRANGGIYTGDLTKQVTHLVACKAEGRKYHAAKNWGLHTVSIEWMKDSIARGMILDEKCYDPILPQDKRGVGAWNKKTITRSVSLGKRSRDPATGQDDGKRKLRKTASVKLTNQRENLWGDILGKPQIVEAAPVVKPEPANPTQPAPTIPVEYTTSQMQSLGSKPMDTQMTRISSFGPPDDGRVFASCGFYVHGFSEQKTAVVVGAVSSLGGLVCHSLDDLASASGAQLSCRFLVVPQTSTAESHPQIPENVDIITEFYIERCMHKKYFFNPADHVFGRPFPAFPISGFEGLTVCTAGFTGVDLNHMDKALRQLGAKYEERFTADSSVLICLSLSNVRPEKLQLALKWKVPVVKADWLWECISTGFNLPITKFLFADLRQNVTSENLGVWPDQEKTQQKHNNPRHTISEQEFPPKPTAKSRNRGIMDSSGFASSSRSKETDTSKPAKAPINRNDSTTTETTHFETAPTHPLQMNSSGTGESSSSRSGASAPLSETNPNVLNRASASPKKPPPRKSISRVFSEVADSEADSDVGQLSHLPTPVEHEPDVSATEDVEPEVKLDIELDMHPDPEPEEDAGEISKRLLEEKLAAERLNLETKLATSLFGSVIHEDPSSARVDPDAAPGPRAAPKRRKREVLGRAISNVSATSSNGGEPTPPTIRRKGF
ncbi:S-M checkpoint control protein rad4 [Echria macrotheca]|uniref:S-M checkpoint control protein rad4 n=1 Tax=Echria macrotheca TaxID=438768 RepID=A0AAJ0B6V4_9PEZI|nr:S-M checkpoint control protein rad4 [Echria macrotheca]